MALSIRSKVNLGMFAGIGVLLVVFGLTWRSLTDLIENRRDVAASQAVVFQVGGAMSLGKDIEAGGRGFVITGDARFLAPLEVARGRLGPALDALRQATIATGRHQPLADTLAIQLRARLHFQDSLVAAMREGGFAAASSLVASGRGRDIMDSARRTADELVRRETAFATSLERTAEAQAARALRIALLAAGLGLVFGLVTLLGFNRQLSVRQAAERRLAHMMTWMSSVMEIQQAVATAGFDVRPLIQKVLTRTQILTGATGAAIHVIDGDLLEIKAATGVLRDHIGLRRAGEGTLAGLCVETEEAQVSADVEADPRLDAEAYAALGVRSLVVVPLMHEDAVLGVLEAGSDRPATFDEDDLETVRLVAGLVASHLGRALAFREKEWDIERRRRAQAELEILAQELARSNQELEQFAYVASHDLQEPLRMVSSYLQLLSRRYHGKLDADADEFIGFAVDGAARMQALIADLLAYSRAGRQPLTPTDVDCGDLLDVVLRDLGPAIRDSGATVERGDLPTVVGDRTQLRQLFQNLLGNAIKFRSEAPPRIEIRAIRDGALWEISFADNGIGIAPEHRQRIFQIFQRLHARDEYAGTGIGLAICQRIAERHGGHIRVEATPGGGSTFRVTLAAAEALPDRVNFEAGEPIMV